MGQRTKKICRGGINMDTEKLLNPVRAFIENIRRKYPEITNDVIDGGYGDESIYYSNAQNGTKFDWYVNYKVSPFLVYFNENVNEGRGFIKIIIGKDGTMKGYVYPHGEIRPLTEYTEDYGKENANLLAALMNKVADDELLWNVNISKFSFSKQTFEMFEDEE